MQVCTHTPAYADLHVHKYHGCTTAPDCSGVLVQELSRRKSEVGRLRKRVRVLEVLSFPCLVLRASCPNPSSQERPPLTKMMSGWLCQETLASCGNLVEMENSLISKDAELQRLHEIIAATHPEAVVER